MNHGVNYFNAVFFSGAFLYAFFIHTIFIYDEVQSLTHFALSFLLLMVTIVYTYKKSLIGPMTIFFAIAYLLPFNHMTGYLIYGYDNIKSFWTPNPNIRPFLDDPELVNLVGCIAASAALGIAAAMSSSGFWVEVKKLQLETSTLSLKQYVLLLFISIFLAWAGMPADSIIEAAYTQSQARFAWFNWPSAWLLSYIIIALLYSDYIMDNSRGAKIKWVFLLCSLFYLVVINDLGNGKRTSLPLVFGLFIYHLTFVSSKKKINFMKGVLILTFTLIFIFIGNMHGALRGELFQISSLEDLFEIFIELKDRDVLGINIIAYGTWTDVLLTPFSVAYMYINKRDLLLGVDYLNMILSLPPAFISDYLGYVRPWNSDKSPAWEMIFGNGGVHATVLPFRNFGLIGVTLVSYLSTLFVIYIEKIQAIRISYFQPFLYISIMAIIPHWVWYGEKPLINGLIYMLLMAWTYKKLLVIKL